MRGRYLINLCFVMNLPQENFFQWEIALRNYVSSEFKIDFVTIDSDLIPESKLETLKNADVIFVRCVGHNINWEWYKLPFIIRKVAPKTKIIYQEDMDFMWLFIPNHYIWNDLPTEAKGKSPEEFLDECNLLEVIDAWNIEYNPLLEQYIKKRSSKPIYHLFLPQLVRYKEYLQVFPSKSELKTKMRNIALLKHSVKSASIKHLVENLSYHFKIFNSTSHEGRMPLQGFMFLLSHNCYIAIDDNENYKAWSRFGMECALAHVPCIGSMPSIKLFFPELYTRHQDYDKQKKLIERLFNDEDFWLRMAKTGKENVLRIMNTSQLTNKLFQIVKRVQNA